jgi:hypothetical protein
MSASSSPTRAPARASATARFALIVDFPTPPFPDATATTLRTPGIVRFPSPGSFAARTSEETRTSTEATPWTARTASSTAARICSFIGHAGVVRTRSSATAPSVTSTFRIMFSVTRSFPSSGSITFESAERISPGATPAAAFFFVKNAMSFTSRSDARIIADRAPPPLDRRQARRFFGGAPHLLRL